MDDFAETYNAGRVAAPDWVRRLVPRVSTNSLYAWLKLRRKGGGLAALADRRAARREPRSFIDSDPELREFIAAVIYDRHHLPATAVLDRIRVHFPPERVPRERTLRRWIAAWRRDNAPGLLAVTNPDKWKSKYRSAFGDADENIVRPNQVWEADSTRSDVFCLVDGAARRHALVAVIDVWSRRAKVLVAPTSRSEAIAALLRRAIVDWGVPETFRTDNGSDYVSAHLVGAYEDLGIRHDPCLHFTPEDKPFIERFMGTISRGLFEGLPGYAGHSVADAQEIRSRKSFAQRFGGADGFEVALTPDDLQKRCDVWCEARYGRREHSDLGCSPFERAASWTGPVAKIENERALDILLLEPAQGRWRTVLKDGLHVEGGVHIAAELGEWIGRKVQVFRDAVDLGTVLVRDPDGAFICWAADPERVGMDRREVAAIARALQRRWRAGKVREAKRLISENRPHELMDRMLAADEEEAARVVALPRPGVSHETPALDAAAEAARARRRRGPAPLTDDQIAAAAEYRAEAEARTAPAAPALREDGAPLDDDVAFYLWCEANPDLADDADRALCARLMEESATFARLVDRARACPGLDPGAGALGGSQDKKTA